MQPLPRLRALEILRIPSDEGESFLLRDPEGFSDEELVLNEPGLFVASHLDGEQTIEDLRDRFERRYGELPDSEQIAELVRRFDSGFLLENDAFDRRREEMVRTFTEAPVRTPAHAGVSYPDDPDESWAAFTGFREAAKGLAEPGEPPEGTLRGMVAPHIDLRVGGPCTALAYGLLDDAPQVETVIVLGTAHACAHPAWIVLEKPFETPLGRVEVDTEIASRLAAAAPASPELGWFHRKEHSIEFQAWFLAGLNREGRKLRVVPVLCGSLRTLLTAEDGVPVAVEVPETPPPPPDPGAVPFLNALRAVLAEAGERAVVLAAADLAHVGPRFGEPEALSEEHLKLLDTKDRETLAFVEQGEASGFYGAVMEGNDPRHICGLAPIYGAMTALPGARGKLLRYEQATDPTGTVSYASMGIWGSVRAG
jgi:predicted class III extradiol MEMO1 family dioxygenase